MPPRKSNGKSIEARIGILEEVTSFFKDEFKEIKDTLKSIDMHIRKSIEFNEEVKHSIRQQHAMQNDINDVRQSLEDHVEEEREYWAKRDEEEQEYREKRARERKEEQEKNDEFRSKITKLLWVGGTVIAVLTFILNNKEFVINLLT